MRNKNITLFLAAVLLMFLPACSLMGSLSPTALPPTEVPSPLPPAPTLAPSPLPSEPSAAVIEETVVLTSQSVETQDDTLHLDVSITRPVMEQPQNKADGFNQAVDDFVQRQVDSFTTQVLDNQEFQTQSALFAEARNGLHLDYTATNTERGIVSIHFTLSNYLVGGAHPNNFSGILNYDLAQERILTLDELFLPGSDYLQTLSDESVQVLNATGFMDFPAGAAPDPLNYQMWNVTPQGILITFDPYQVAPYAAGPQQALVSYAALAGLIDPDGPLGAFLP